MPQTLSAEWREHLDRAWAGPRRGARRARPHARQPDADRFQRDAEQQPVRAQAGDLRREPPGDEQGARRRRRVGPRRDPCAGRTLAEKINRDLARPISRRHVGAPTGSTGRASTPRSPRSRGRWTSYGALAELAGTSAQAVGRYVANTPRRRTPTACLSADGAVSESFHWSDENDQRNPGRSSKPRKSASTMTATPPKISGSHRKMAASVEAPEEALDEDSTRSRSRLGLREGAERAAREHEGRRRDSAPIIPAGARVLVWTKAEPRSRSDLDERQRRPLSPDPSQGGITQTRERARPGRRWVSLPRPVPFSTSARDYCRSQWRAPASRPMRQGGRCPSRGC